MAFASIEEAEAAIKELRQENAKWRLQVRTLEDDVASAKAEKDKLTGEKDSIAQSISKLQADHEAALKSANETKDAEIAAIKNTVQDQIKRSKLEALALQQGIKDLDGLKLIDTSEIELAEDGVLTGVDDAFWKAAKEAKPYLFGDARNTTTTKPAPKGGDTTPPNVLAMSKEDYEKHKAAVLAAAR